MSSLDPDRSDTAAAARTMSNSPAISVVLPVHNGSRYLDRSVESLVAQTCRDWELILVDDASTDDTPLKIEAWAAADDRIHAIRLAQNRKLPGALNEGFQRARGELLSWTSDDNCYAPNALARMLEVLREKPQVDVVYADYTLVDEEGSPLGVEPVRPREDLVLYNCVGPCFLFRRRVLQQLGGYDEAMFLAEDYDFWLRASLEFRLEPLHEPLYFYRRHGGSLSARRSPEISIASQVAVERWLPQAAWLTRTTRGRALEALGLRALLRGDAGTGRQYLLRAMLLLRRPPRFHRCRSYAVDWLLGSRAGNLVRRCCLGRSKHPTGGISS